MQEFLPSVSQVRNKIVWLAQNLPFSLVHVSGLPQFPPALHFSCAAAAPAGLGWPGKPWRTWQHHSELLQLQVGSGQVCPSPIQALRAPFGAGQANGHAAHQEFRSVLKAVLLQAAAPCMEMHLFTPVL